MSNIYEFGISNYIGHLLREMGSNLLKTLDASTRQMEHGNTPKELYLCTSLEVWMTRKCLLYIYMMIGEF